MFPLVENWHAKWCKVLYFNMLRFNLEQLTFFLSYLLIVLITPEIKVVYFIIKSW